MSLRSFDMQFSPVKHCLRVASGTDAAASIPEKLSHDLKKEHFWLPALSLPYSQAVPERGALSTIEKSGTPSQRAAGNQRRG